MHKNFAYIYDEFTKHVDYNSWYKFLRKYIKKKGKVLDIGCGTATITKKFYEDGFDVTAVDISKDMIDIAKLKCPNIDYRVLDIEKEKINEKFEYIISNFDTVNYLSSINKFIKNCSSMQEKGNYLIFDIITEEIFYEMFENDIFIDETEKYFNVWHHKKLKNNKHNIEIVGFIKNEDETYQKYVETHIKYIYDIRKIIEILNQNNYILYDVAKNPKYGQSRVFLIAKKE